MVWLLSAHVCDGGRNLFYGRDERSVLLRFPTARDVRKSYSLASVCNHCVRIKGYGYIASTKIRAKACATVHHNL